ncbi:MAG: preprotein translocase subunit SecY [Collinsella sp.]
MFQTFRNAWKIPELKNRLLFTLAILVVYRLGCAIPVPFVSGSALTQMFANGDMLSYLNMMSGGALARCTLFALGVTPYINASIIVQLLTVAILAGKSGEGSRRPAEAAADQPVRRCCDRSDHEHRLLLRDPQHGRTEVQLPARPASLPPCHHRDLWAGAQLITWCGEQIDDKGIGNGVSL